MIESRRRLGYSPLAAGIQSRINEHWSLYRTQIELEGNLYLRLKSSGKSEPEIGQEIVNRRKNIEEDKNAWYNLIGRKKDKNGR